MSSTSLTLNRARRIRRRSEFLVAQRQGKRLHSPHLVMLVHRRPDDSNAGREARLGVVVTKKIGNAVVRNRCKRRCRELFRLARAQLPPTLDLVLIPRPALATAPFAALQHEWLTLVGRLS